MVDNITIPGAEIKLDVLVAACFHHVRCAFVYAGTSTSFSAASNVRARPVGAYCHLPKQYCGVHRCPCIQIWIPICSPEVLFVIQDVHVAVTQRAAVVVFGGRTHSLHRVRWDTTLQT